VLYFDCHMCGECCSSWNISIEAEKAEQLLKKPWAQARLQEVSRQLTPMTPDTYRIPLTDENVCVFLAEDKRCLVEAHEGLTLKPHECQRFPFATVRLPDGTDWHETSAACKSISEKLLLAFQPIQPRPAKPNLPASERMAAIAAGVTSTDSRADRPIETRFDDPLAASMDDMSDWSAPMGIDAALEPLAHFPKRIPVCGFCHISKTQYQMYQRQLRDLFMNPETHPEAALQDVYRLLHAIASPKSTSKNNKADSEGFNCSTGHIQAARWRFKPLLAELLLIIFLRKPYRTMSWVSLFLGRTYPDPRIFGMPVDLAQQRKIAWESTPAVRLNLRLNAFLFNLLQRKRLIALGSSLSSHLAMAGVACLLVQWYAKTLAWFQGSPSPSESDIASAIRLVERYYTGHQPRFLAFFTSRWRGELIASLLFSL
jgi:Fe-S-cluster containining protein